MVFLGGAFGFMFAIENEKFCCRRPLLLAFRFMGLMLSSLLGAVLGWQRRQLDHDRVCGTGRCSLAWQCVERDQARLVRTWQMAVRRAIVIFVAAIAKCSFSRVH